MTSKFKWGETAFDKMSHTELLLIAKKMYPPLIELRCEVRMMENGISGICRYETLPMAEEVIKQIHKKTDSEKMFRQYYRYAVDLLYKCSKKEWRICTVKDCGTMMTGGGNCLEHDKPMKKITWGIFK